MNEIEAQKVSILDYFSKNKFRIPLYQRPYVWDTDHCEQLWDDIEEFFNENSKKEISSKEEYFLGSTVMYKEKDKQNIIDGQQRTTTLSLLIKALHRIASNDKSNEASELIANLGKCLWDIDNISGKVNKEQLHLESEVATEDDNKILKDILSDNYKVSNESDLEKKKKLRDKNTSNYEKIICIL